MGLATNSELAASDAKDSCIIPKNGLTFLLSDNLTKEREKGNPAAALVSKCESAMLALPANHIGLVLGSGYNTPVWRERGWQTLDIDWINWAGMGRPDYCMDANRFADAVPRGSLDYVLAEYLSVGNQAGIMVKTHTVDQPVVGYARLLEQAQMALKPGGKLILHTFDTGKTDEKKNTLSAIDLGQMFLRHGFKAVLVAGDSDDYFDRKRTTALVNWYAIKTEDFVL